MLKPRTPSRMLSLIGAAVVLIICGASARAQEQKLDTPIAVKVVVVAMFEHGQDTGDSLGEYQYWVEREHLDQIFPMPAGYHHVRMNKDRVLGLLTGVGTAKAAASVIFESSRTG
jgi:purine nucleoside permease